MHSFEFISAESDQLVRAAWLYYVGGNTQEQTAEILGVSRVKVARLLAEAREAGIVKISIEHRFGPMAEVEETIRKHYSLRFCRATPPLLSDSVERPAKMLSPAKLADEGPPARRAVAMIAVELLRERMQVDEECIIGVGWGRTTAEVASLMPAMRRPQVKFVSVMGSLTRNLAANLFEVVHKLAAKTGGEGHFLPVPFIANTVADRQILMSQRIVQETLALGEKANFYMISVGECDERAFLFENRYLSAEELAELRAAGAVGDAMGKFFNAEGQVVSSELNERTLAIDLNILRQQEVILLCGGRSKLRPAQGILKAGFVDGLLVDGDSASQMFHEIRAEVAS
ncbi:MAG: sugar-binding transcriptional regulator [Verrucomicrobia bacterium]|nr:sugar-binding transcriptional regulator [Verrucomicrobiota bacterium]MBV9275248.1 sugar-binding transcriptional regulator [Verrucomicrobiota bacterium]